MGEGLPLESCELLHSLTAGGGNLPIYSRKEAELQSAEFVTEKRPGKYDRNRGDEVEHRVGPPSLNRSSCLSLHEARRLLFMIIWHI